MLLLNPDQTHSPVFKIPAGGEVTVLATGLQDADEVRFEILALTGAGPAGDVCCPGPVTLPDVGWTAPLKVACGCDAPQAVVLTAGQPWVVLDRPREVSLRAVKVADADAVVEVHLYNTGK